MSAYVLIKQPQCQMLHMLFNLSASSWGTSCQPDFIGENMHLNKVKILAEVTEAEIKPRWGDSKAMSHRTSLVLQWLRLWAPNAGGLGSIPGQRTRSHVPQLRVCILQYFLRSGAIKKKKCHELLLLSSLGASLCPSSHTPVLANTHLQAWMQLPTVPKA